jgi:hypothetical protein
MEGSNYVSAATLNSTDQPRYFDLTHNATTLRDNQDDIMGIATREHWLRVRLAPPSLEPHRKASLRRSPIWHNRVFPAKKHRDASTAGKCVFSPVNISKSSLLHCTASQSASPHTMTPRHPEVAQSDLVPTCITYRESSELSQCRAFPRLRKIPHNRRQNLPGNIPKIPGRSPAPF